MTYEQTGGHSAPPTPSTTLPKVPPGPAPGELAGAGITDSGFRFNQAREVLVRVATARLPLSKNEIDYLDGVRLREGDIVLCLGHSANEVLVYQQRRFPTCIPLPDGQRVKVFEGRTHAEKVCMFIPNRGWCQIDDAPSTTSPYRLNFALAVQDLANRTQLTFQQARQVLHRIAPPEGGPAAVPPPTLPYEDLLPNLVLIFQPDWNNRSRDDIAHALDNLISLAHSAGRREARNVNVNAP